MIFVNNECTYKIFNDNNTVDLTAVSSLHAELLPHSPVALLGEDFMTGFYYKVLPETGLISGIVVYVEGKPAGFISMTDDSAGFMKKAVFRKWPKLVYVLLISLLKEPRRIISMWEAFNIMINLPDSAKRENSGELLSLGILPEYRNIKNGESGENLATVLVLKAVDILKTAGCKEIRVVVDDNNKVAKFFYHGLGWKLGKEKLKGWRTPSIEFVLSD